MNYQSPRLLDALAGQYVLGTLRGLARQRFERLSQRDAHVVAAIHRWEDRLLDLSSQVDPVQPSSLVWQRIRRQLRRPNTHERWLPQQARLAIAAGVATLAVALGLWTWNETSSSQLIATIANQESPLWRIEARPELEALNVVATQGVAFDPQHAYELWALPASGGAPVSLGLMPKRGERALPLSDAQRVALAQSNKVAISLEPLSGSPTGAPTGPILFVADLIVRS
jgi:anti-sigma-K factor RskA